MESVTAPQKKCLSAHLWALSGCERRGVGSPLCTIMVYPTHMPLSKQVRRSVTLPAQIDKQIETIARTRRLSGNRVLLELLELGLAARRQKEKEFFEVAERFRNSNDPEEVKQLGDELGRFVFGE